MIRFESNNKNFIISFDQRFPFNWKTPLGYLVGWLAESAGFYNLALMVVLLVNSVISTCWFFIFMTDDITNDLEAFNNDVKTKQNRDDQINRFASIVQFYSEAKE